MKGTDMSQSETPKYPYYKHDDGVVVTQPRSGEFEERPMTEGELAAREPALTIAQDIYRHANFAGACYFEIWDLIARTVDTALAAAQERIAQVERALCELTPGGSEYAGDADSCVRYIREARQSQHDAILKATKRAQAAESRCAVLREALRELLASDTPMPPFEAGQEAQTAWADRKEKAHQDARAALAKEAKHE